MTEKPSTPVSQPPVTQAPSQPISPKYDYLCYFSHLPSRPQPQIGAKKTEATPQTSLYVLQLVNLTNNQSKTCTKCE